MPHLSDLYPLIADRIVPPVCVAFGPPQAAAHLVAALPPGTPTTCAQLDLFPAERLTQTLPELGATAEVVTVADLWDLPPTFNTVLFPATSYSDRELKIDVIEQAYHILQPGGRLISLSEYARDSQFAKWQKRVFGKCGETPSSKAGMAFWSTRGDDIPRRRHEVNFHARLGDGPSMNFVSRPGLFSYGRFDVGSRALVEVADLRPGEHVLDLGSGVGVVGCLASTKTGPTGATTFIDSNLRAAALSKLNAEANGVPNATIVTDANMNQLPVAGFDVVLANPPYYGDSVVARLFVAKSRELLKRGGRFYIVTKMPTAVVPLIFESFGGCDVIENRGYTVVTAVV